MKKEVIAVLIETLAKSYSPQKIILFGSHAWGKPTSDSDIDIFIIKDTEKKQRERFSEVQKILHGLHGSIPVEPLVLTPTELERRKRLQDPFILRILKEGRVLYG